MKKTLVSIAFMFLAAAFGAMIVSALLPVSAYAGDTMPDGGGCGGVGGGGGSDPDGSGGGVLF